jgi:hypothetical protein
MANKCSGNVTWWSTYRGPRLGTYYLGSTNIYYLNTMTSITTYLVLRGKIADEFLYGNHEK